MILDDTRFDIDDHQIITQIMGGVFNIRPFLPQYIYTQNVSEVIQYLKSMSPINSVS